MSLKDHVRLDIPPQGLTRSISNFVPVVASIKNIKQIDADQISFLKLRSRLSEENSENYNELGNQDDSSESIEKSQNSQ